MRLAIGIDLGGTNIKGGLIDDGGKVLAQDEVPTLAREGPDAVIGRMGKLALALKGKAGGKVEGIGVGSPGPLHPTAGFIYTTPNMPGWENYSIKKNLEAKTGLKVTVENDANVAALAEGWKGAGKGARCSILLTLGTGIGGGILRDGKLINGATMTAGEVGHIVIDYNGPKCGCGNNGCLEAYCGTAGILNRAWELLDKPGTVSILRDWAGNDRLKMTPALISKAAGQGDGVALSVLRETGRLLGVGLVSLCNLFAPEVFILGGGVAAAGDVLFNAAREEVKRHAFAPASQQVRIVPAEMGNNAGVVGAAALFLSR
jgi:glucokinase